MKDFGVLRKIAGFQIFDFQPAVVVVASESCGGSGNPTLREVVLAHPFPLSDRKVRTAPVAKAKARVQNSWIAIELKDGNRSRQRNRFRAMQSVVPTPGRIDVVSGRQRPD